MADSWRSRSSSGTRVRLVCGDRRSAVGDSRRGDGHAVLVLPGLGGNDASTAPLRWFIARLGYRSYGWGLGANRGFGRHVTDGLDELLAPAHETGPVSLVGWSLGGVHAIELARRQPDAVRSIITLGSPLVGRRRPPAGIPTTSVYSRTDAIVSWRASLLPGAPLHENVEVRGSHLGLGHNPAVAVVVADRLAQRPETWQPFQPPRGPGAGCRRHDELVRRGLHPGNDQPQPGQGSQRTLVPLGMARRVLSVQLDESLVDAVTGRPPTRARPRTRSCVRHSSSTSAFGAWRCSMSSSRPQAPSHP